MVHLGVGRFPGCIGKGGMGYLITLKVYLSVPSLKVCLDVPTLKVYVGVPTLILYLTETDPA